MHRCGAEDRQRQALRLSRSTEHSKAGADGVPHDVTEKSCAAARQRGPRDALEGVTPGGPSLLVDLDVHDASGVNQHVAAIGGAATDDLALVER